MAIALYKAGMRPASMSCVKIPYLKGLFVRMWHVQSKGADLPYSKRLAFVGTSRVDQTTYPIEYFDHDAWSSRSGD